MATKERARWEVCGITGEELVLEEAVSCKKGRLYNHENVLRWQLWSRGIFLNDDERDRYENLIRKGALETLRHIRKRKDKSGKPTTFPVLLPKDMICPVTSQSLKSCKSVCIAGCGHVFRKTEFKETTNKCCVCGKAYVNDDLVLLLPTPDTDTAPHSSSRDLQMPKKRRREGN